MDVFRQIRTCADLTQSELAVRAGTSQPTIAQYEAGTKSPTVRTVERLAHAAGLHVELTVSPRLTREDRRCIALHRAIALHLATQPGVTLARARKTLAGPQDTCWPATHWRACVRRIRTRRVCSMNGGCC